jgi:uncharacterized membrane protein SirB2
MDYATLKAIHQGAAALSFAGFALRGAGSFAGAAWVRGRAARTLPHVVDSVLLLSALGLAWTLGLERAVPAWLLAKVAGLLVYIGLGLIALRPGRPTWVRAIAWVAALATFGWIVSVAVTKDSLGFVSLAL